LDTLATVLVVFVSLPCQEFLEELPLIGWGLHAKTDTW